MSFSVQPFTSPALMCLSSSLFPFIMLHFVSPHQFYFWHLFFFSYFVPDVILPFCYFTAGTLLLIINSLNIPPTAHLFFTFTPEQGMKQELPALFSSFFTPHSPFLSSVWRCYHLLLRLIIPAGSFQNPDQRGEWNFVNLLILWCSAVSLLRGWR